MSLRQMYAGHRWGLSFEIYPPKTPEGDDSLRRTLGDLTKHNPGFISCTYGAGGSTSKRTLEWCSEIQNQFDQVAVAHLTCLDHDQHELLEWLHSAHHQGVRNIMALRGDRPTQGPALPYRPDSLKYANQLVSLIRANFPEFGIGVAGYPERHAEAPDADTDLRHLARKVAMGADAIFTQLFFDNSVFLSFRERLHTLGVTVPIIPGIMPITDFDQIQRISSLCGISIPTALAASLESVKDDRAAQHEIGVEFATRQCQQLLETGVPGLHFYVLNRSRACLQILSELPRADIE